MFQRFLTLGALFFTLICSTPSAVPNPVSIQTLKDYTVAIKIDDRSGSGVIISPNGFIISVYHVTYSGHSFLNNGKNSLKVWLNGKEYEGEVIRYSPGKDLSLVKIEAENLAFAKLGFQYEVGEEVTAVGNALGRIEDVVTFGRVSGFDETLGLLVVDIRFIIGMSGGGVFNKQGELLGIPEVGFGLTTDTLNCAIPARTIQEFLGTEELLNNNSDE